MQELRADTGWVAAVLSSTESFICLKTFLFIEQNSSLDMLTSDYTSFTALIGTVILDTFQICSCRGITDESLNMDGLSLVFITNPTVLKMLVLIQKVRKKLFQGTGLLLSTKYSKNKCTKVAKLCKYWPELNAATFEKWNTINVYTEVYSITLSDLKTGRSPSLRHNICTVRHIYQQMFYLVV